MTVTVTGLDEAAANRIVAENQLPGTPQSVWGVNGPTTAIEGFATDISVDQGQRIDFKVNTIATDYRIDIYRMGYYQGNGARYITTIEPTDIRQQPAPLRDNSTGLADAGNWAVSASWNVPTDAVSGVYIAKLVGEAGTSAENHMYFVVRDDDGRSDMLFQTADTTWQAYNLWGGENFYTGTPSSPTQAKKVSYNRPFGAATNSVNMPLMDAEYPMIRWLEANGYNVSYTTGVDTDRRGQELLEHEAFLSVGHDEYWSGQQRTNVEAARDAGVNLAFFAATRCIGRHAGRTASTVPEHLAGPSLPTRRLGTTRRAIPIRSGPERGAIHGSARPPTEVDRRTNSRERYSRSIPIGPIRSRCPQRTARCASGAIPASPISELARWRP